MVCLMPQAEVKLWNACPVYCGPLSVMISSGRPNRAEYVFTLSATALLVTGVGISSTIGYFVYLSTVRRYCWPCISKRSEAMYCHGRDGMSCGCSGSFLFAS